MTTKLTTLQSYVNQNIKTKPRRKKVSTTTAKTINKTVEPHVTGVIVEHDLGGGKLVQTGIKAEIVHDQVRLVIKQGGGEIKCRAADWKFINDQIEVTLGKKRLIHAK